VVIGPDPPKPFLFLGICFLTPTVSFPPVFLLFDWFGESHSRASYLLSQCTSGRFSPLYGCNFFFFFFYTPPTQTGFWYRLTTPFCTPLPTITQKERFSPLASLHIDRKDAAFPPFQFFASVFSGSVFFARFAFSAPLSFLPFSFVLENLQGVLPLEPAASRFCPLF